MSTLYINRLHFKLNQVNCFMWHSLNFKPKVHFQCKQGLLSLCLELLSVRVKLLRHFIKHQQVQPPIVTLDRKEKQNVISVYRGFK